MSNEWLDAYVAAWEVHPRAGGPDYRDMASLLVQLGVVPAPDFSA